MKTFIEFINESAVNRDDVIKAIRLILGSNTKEYSHSKLSNGFLPKNKVLVSKLISELLKLKGLHVSINGRESFGGYYEWSITGSGGYGNEIVIDIDSTDQKHVRNVIVQSTKDLS